MESDVRFWMQKRLPPGHGSFYYPSVSVTLRKDGVESRRVDAVVDTGSCITLVRSSLAVQLGITDWDQGHPMDVGGLGGAGKAYECPVPIDLSLGVNGELKVPDARVYFTSSAFSTQYLVLLGQRDFLERHIFIHLNAGPKPFIKLHRS